MRNHGVWVCISGENLIPQEKPKKVWTVKHCWVPSSTTQKSLEYIFCHTTTPRYFFVGVWGGGGGGGGGCKRGLFSELYGYLVCGLVLFLIVLKVFPIVTNLQIVLGHPLRVIISSLGCYSCYSCPLPTNINLYPLTQITYPNHPSSRACFVIKPPKRDGMWNRIPFWRCSNLSICDHSIWHAESVLATS